MTCVVGDSFGGSLHELTTGTRHFEQALRVDRPTPTLYFAPLASCLLLKGNAQRKPPKSKSAQGLKPYTFMIAFQGIEP